MFSLPFGAQMHQKGWKYHTFKRGGMLGLAYLRQEAVNAENRGSGECTEHIRSLRACLTFRLD